MPKSRSRNKKKGRRRRAATRTITVGGAQIKVRSFDELLRVLERVAAEGVELALKRAGVAPLREKVAAAVENRLRAVRRIAKTRQLASEGRVGPLGPLSMKDDASVYILLDDVIVAAVVDPRIVRQKADATDDALWIGELDEDEKLAIIDALLSE